MNCGLRNDIVLMDFHAFIPSFTRAGVYLLVLFFFLTLSYFSALYIDRKTFSYYQWLESTLLLKRENFKGYDDCNYFLIQSREINKFQLINSLKSQDRLKCVCKIERKLKYPKRTLYMKFTDFFLAHTYTHALSEDAFYWSVGIVSEYQQTLRLEFSSRHMRPHVHKPCNPIEVSRQLK